MERMVAGRGREVERGKIVENGCVLKAPAQGTYRLMSATWKFPPVLIEYTMSDIEAKTMSEKTKPRAPFAKASIRLSSRSGCFIQASREEGSVLASPAPTGRMRGISGGIVPGTRGGIYPARRACAAQRCHGDLLAIM